MPQSPIAAVLFDYGLVLTGPPDPAAWARMQQIASLHAGPQDEQTFAEAYWAHRLDYDRGTLTGRQYWAAIAPQAPADALGQLIAADTVLWTQLNQPMVDWALRLQAAGTPTGILSNLGDEMMHGVLATLPWMADFTHSTFSHTLLLTKPDPAIYAHAAAGLALSPATILFIDDREDNIAGALAAGMQAIQYTDHQGFLAELERRNLKHLWQSGRLSCR